MDGHLRLTTHTDRAKGAVTAMAKAITELKVLLDAPTTAPRASQPIPRRKKTRPAPAATPEPPPLTPPPIPEPRSTRIERDETVRSIPIQFKVTKKERELIGYMALTRGITISDLLLHAVLSLQKSETPRK